MEWHHAPISVCKIKPVSQILYILNITAHICTKKTWLFSFQFFWSGWFLFDSVPLQICQTKWLTVITIYFAHSKISFLQHHMHTIFTIIFLQCDTKTSIANLPLMSSTVLQKHLTAPDLSQPINCELSSEFKIQFQKSLTIYCRLMKFYPYLEKYIKIITYK